MVDVEATGLRPRQDRVLSIGVVLLAPDGSVEHRWSTLLDPGCDPGPVHIHGLTREVLAGSPTFDQVQGQLAGLLANRVLVAHNARYDWAMLASEALRAGQALPVANRLCTWVLSRRLDLPVPDLKLGTLAAHWGVAQTRAHDAADDAAVLAALLPRLLRVAAEQELELPLTPCAAELPPPFPGRGPRIPCPYVNPGRLGAVAGGLAQGMVAVFTGPSRMPRERLETMATEAGLKVTDAVNGATSLLVTNDVGSGSRKARAALARDIPVVDEETFLRLLADIRPGVRRPLAVVTDPAPDQAARPAAADGRLTAIEAGPAVSEADEEPRPVPAEPAARRATAGLAVPAEPGQIVELPGLTEPPGPVEPAGPGAAPGAVPAAALGGTVREIRTARRARAEGQCPRGVRRVLRLAEIYRRGGAWRPRAVGQDYDHGLAELVPAYDTNITTDTDSDDVDTGDEGS
ncbi:hypothetical protein I7412_27940 [Frankia sp. CN6]|uniref:BRCT domain-containing protein n=1 Tax=Frankia nepalensis TaxID=1836974 RepID=A0A937RS40_9ACTN|nr:hypothetical protein [Frankia nepalensis]